MSALCMWSIPKTRADLPSATSSTLDSLGSCRSRSLLPVLPRRRCISHRTRYAPISLNLPIRRANQSHPRRHTMTTTATTFSLPRRLAEMSPLTPPSLTPYCSSGGAASSRCTRTAVDLPTVRSSWMSLYSSLLVRMAKPAGRSTSTTPPRLPSKRANLQSGNLPSMERL